MLPPPEFLLTALGYGVLAPAVVTALGLLLALRRGGGEPVATGAGLAAGFAALAAGGLIGWGFLRPAEAWDWLPALALLATAAALAEQLGKRPHVVRCAARLAVAALTAWLLVGAQAAREPVDPYWYAGLALAVLALWGLLDRAARRRPGAATPALLAGVAFAAGAVAELANFSTPAHLSGVLGGVLAGCALVAWRRPREGVTRAGVPVLAVLLPGLLFVTYFTTFSFSDVPAASYLLLLAAPLCLSAAALVPIGKPSGRWEVAVRAASALVPIGAALTLAARA
jgi:hypothetical protein